MLLIQYTFTKVKLPKRETEEKKIAGSYEYSHLESKIREFSFSNKTTFEYSITYLKIDTPLAFLFAFECIIPIYLQGSGIVFRK